ncbi:MAG: hypothetical protein FWC34_10945 [Bacteroidetes bacterium]|nr:hypothetical protein [Bacteroidota bacterium]MCL2302942.1 hypothetical protein [Lentimicrobiaceae bacterium]
MVLFNYNGNLALESRWLWDNGVISRNNYDIRVNRKSITVLQRSAPGCPAIISYESLPYNIKDKISTKLQELGELSAIGTNANVPIEKQPQPCFFERYIKPDPAALEFYAKYPPEKALEYHTNAIILNAFRDLLSERTSVRAAKGSRSVKRSGVFASVLGDLKLLDRKKYPHTLPLSDRNLRPKYQEYIKDGYKSLIHKNTDNNYARIVTADIERILMSLAVASNNPYAEWVHGQYCQFLSGEIDVVDVKTGVLFNREEFCNDKGEPSYISESTVWNYLNNPANKAVIDSIRLGYHQFGALARPHYHRENARYSLSKVSLDDRDLPRKMHDGNRVKAYYAYDVHSGVLIGACYSRKKDTDLFVGCLRNMFRNLDEMNLGLPLEMEVENHLVRQFEDDLLKAGNLFPFVRWCAPTNSQEKHAEQFNRQKKYGYEKRYQDGIGRFYAKLDVNRTNGERVYNEVTDRYEIKTKTYSYEQLVADDLLTVKEYNEGLHRDQKKYPGKSRMQVFLENLNKSLVPINRPLLLRYIGNCTTTSVQRNQYVQVQYADYQLSSPEVLRRLKPGNYNVNAYWLSNAKGAISEVYLYQGDEFLCKADQIEKFTTAKAEWQDADSTAMSGQAQYITSFDKTVKNGRESLAKTRILPKTNYEEIIPVIEEVGPVAESHFAFDLDRLMDKYQSEDYKERCIEAV